MAKLYFRYSAMDAGKTLDLIKVAYNYEDKGQQTFVLNSAIDKRAGENLVKSRVGFTKKALSITVNDNVYNIVKSRLELGKIACVLVDEIHFFTVEQVKQLSDVVDFLHVPVICYGLRSDYRGEVFASSAYLLAIADTLEELKTICHCGAKATFNMLIKNGEVCKEGGQIVVDNEELKAVSSKYVSVCRLHFKKSEF